MKILALLLALVFAGSAQAEGFFPGHLAPPTIASVLAPSAPLVISGQSGVTYSGLRITNPSGDCVRIVNSTNITIKASNIGPCGAGDGSGTGRGVNCVTSDGCKIYDNYIHIETTGGTVDSRDGILINASTNSDIQGNVIAFGGGSNIEVIGGSNVVTVTGNYLLNTIGSLPRAHQFQSAGAAGTPNTNITFTGNYSVNSTNTITYPFAGTQNDAINFYQTSTFTASANYVTGGTSTTGCGIIADQNAVSGTVTLNILWNTGQCGLANASGTANAFSLNKVLNLTPVTGASGNVGLYVQSFYADACGGSSAPNWVSILTNTVAQLKPDLSYNSYFDKGNCGTVNLSGNVLDAAAYTALFPMTTTNPPPLIPPTPKNCVAPSPYSTQTSVAAC